jgi:uncharacterized protein DUF7002
VTLEELANNYPRLYHMAAKGSWPSIRTHGLLSTSALLDLYGMAGNARADIESKHRPTTVLVTDPRLGTVEIRDQKPMSDGSLERALQDGLSPRRWYEILNSKVFCWTNKSRLTRLLCARAYRDDEHDVLWLNTKSLMDELSDRVVLSPINSGCTKPFPHPRGTNTFLSVQHYPWDTWRKKRGVEEAIVEVAFEGGIPEIDKYVERVVRMKTETELATIFAK